jgi:hypothetical protein
VVPEKKMALYTVQLLEYSTALCSVPTVYCTLKDGLNLGVGGGGEVRVFFPNNGWQRNSLKNLEKNMCCSCAKSTIVQMYVHTSFPKKLGLFSSFFK